MSFIKLTRTFLSNISTFCLIYLNLSLFTKVWLYGFPENFVILVTFLKMDFLKMVFLENISSLFNLRFYGKYKFLASTYALSLFALPRLWKVEPFGDVFQNSCSQKFCSIHRKTPVLESLFNDVAELQASSFIKMWLQHKCFPVEIAKFLRKFFYRTPVVAVPIHQPIHYDFSQCLR